MKRKQLLTIFIISEKFSSLAISNISKFASLVFHSECKLIVVNVMKMNKHNASNGLYTSVRSFFKTFFSVEMIYHERLKLRKFLFQCCSSCNILFHYVFGNGKKKCNETSSLRDIPR